MMNRKLRNFKKVIVDTFFSFVAKGDEYGGEPNIFEAVFKYDDRDGTGVGITDNMLSAELGHEMAIKHLRNMIRRLMDRLLIESEEYGVIYTTEAPTDRDLIIRHPSRMEEPIDFTNARYISNWKEELEK